MLRILGKLLGSKGEIVSVNKSILFKNTRCQKIIYMLKINDKLKKAKIHILRKFSDNLLNIVLNQMREKVVIGGGGGVKKQ